MKIEVQKIMDRCEKQILSLAREAMATKGVSQENAEPALHEIVAFQVEDFALKGEHQVLDLGATEARTPSPESLNAAGKKLTQRAKAAIDNPENRTSQGIVQVIKLIDRTIKEEIAREVGSKAENQTGEPTPPAPPSKGWVR